MLVHIHSTGLYKELVFKNVLEHGPCLMRFCPPPLLTRKSRATPYYSHLLSTVAVTHYILADTIFTYPKGMESFVENILSGLETLDILHLRVNMRQSG